MKCGTEISFVLMIYLQAKQRGACGKFRHEGDKLQSEQERFDRSQNPSHVDRGDGQTTTETEKV